MADVQSRLRDLVTPLAADLGVEVFDLEYTGGVVRVTLDREGGVDIDRIADATRLFSRVLDAEDPVAGRYTLEVTSPGLERTLRTPDHLRWALGKEVSVKTVASFDGPRRVRGKLSHVDGETVTVLATEVDGTPVVAAPDTPDQTARPIELRHDQVSQARTVFDWGPGPKPGKGRAKGNDASSGRQKSQKRVSAP